MSESITFENIFETKDELADDISNFWTSHKSKRLTWENRIKETVQYVYATSTRETTNIQNDHSHSTHIPMMTMIKDNLDANYLLNTIPNDNWFQFIGEDQSSVIKNKRDTIESYLKTKHRINKFRNIIAELINDWTLYGNCFARVDYIRETHTDPLTGDIVQGYVGPRVQRISPYDIVFDVSSRSFKESPKVIRSIKRLGDLAREAEENGDNAAFQDILDKATSVRNLAKSLSLEEFNKLCQYQFDGFSNPQDFFNTDYVEILEFYGDIYDKATNTFYKNHAITILDRTWVVKAEPLDTWSGRPNIFHCAWRQRPDNLMGMGPLDNLVGMQYYVNHVENAVADGLDQVLSPDRVIVGDVYIDYGDNGEVEYKIPDGQGTVSNLLPDLSFLNADFRLQNKLSQMELFAGAPREAMGIRTPGEKTATEFNGLMNASSRMFQNKITFFEEQFLEDILNAELETAVRNLDASDIIKITDDETNLQEFMTITRDDLLANGKLTPIGARHFAEQDRLNQGLQLINQSFDPEMREHISSIELSRAITEALGVSNIVKVQPNVRAQERLDMEREARAAQDQLAIEDQQFVDTEGNVAEFIV